MTGRGVATPPGAGRTKQTKYVDRMSPVEIVTAFIAAIEAKDIDTAVSMTSETISYENVPTTPIIGRDNVAAALERFLTPVSNVDWQILSQWAVGRTVINERLDRFQFRDGWLELPVAGIFEIDDSDQIVLWRDYFDMNTYVHRLAELTGS